MRVCHRYGWLMFHLGLAFVALLAGAGSTSSAQAVDVEVEEEAEAASPQVARPG